MSQKNHPPGPIPAGNRPKAGPVTKTDDDVPPPDNEGPPGTGAPASEHDPKNRLGHYGTAGEHPIQQPGGRGDANR